MAGAWGLRELRVPLQIQRSCAREGEAQLQARPGVGDCTGRKRGAARQVSRHAVGSHDEEGKRHKVTALQTVVRDPCGRACSRLIASVLEAETDVEFG
jgi:hypothetical protein